jgi:pimeloyl-ACP methyl ester carboxylesterase
MSNWMTGISAAGGIELHYLRTGGPKPPLVLLHGLTGNGACWSPVARLLQAEFDVVMPDARGHGQSSTPLFGYRYEDHAADVLALMAKLGLAAPILLGHSMGGMTATMVSAQAGSRVRALILADPSFLSAQRQREVRDSDVAEQHRRVLSQSKAELLAELHRRHPHRCGDLLELLATARLQSRLSAFDVLTPPHPDYQQLISIIGVPMLLVLGDSPVVSLETARQLQRLNARIRIEQIQQAGHGLPYDQPERLAAAVRSFLAALAVP